MSKLLKNFLTRRVLGHKRNLASTSDHYEAMARLLQDQPVHGMLDAGASDGRITRKLLRMFPDATAFLFEPHPTYREALEQYQKSDSRVQPQFTALADRQGELTLTLNDQVGMTSMFATNQRSRALFPEGEHSQTGVQVPVTSIDAWRAARGNPPMELMKFDIQAAELTALKGATETLSSTTRLIYAEVFFNPLYEGGALFGEIDAYLREFGFLLYNLYKPKSDHRDMLLWANAIFIRE